MPIAMVPPPSRSSANWRAIASSGGIRKSGGNSTRRNSAVVDDKGLAIQLRRKRVAPNLA